MPVTAEMYGIYLWIMGIPGKHATEVSKSPLLCTVLPCQWSYHNTEIATI